MKPASLKSLTVTSTAFENNGEIPIPYTGRGENMSPDLKLSEIAEGAKSMALIMDDQDVPFRGTLNHWVIWNLPVQTSIPEHIPHGESLASLGGAVQGIGYGKHRYKGPKPPFFIRKFHHYQFHVYVLDCSLSLENTARKKEVLTAMDGHILQHGCLTGKFRNR